MMTYQDMVEMDLIHPNAYYRYYKSYKYLYDYWVEHKKEYRVTDKEMKDRIRYILKNKIKQRDEISTLCWILGIEDERERRL